MNESTARAERFEAQSESSPLYVWEVSQKPVSVRIPFSLIDRLEREAVESFRSLTSKGSEIGGLLIGDVTPGSPLVVSVADYDLIACDYSRGPLYRLSDADMGRFEQAIQQRLASGKGVAGFFRSHTRKGIALDADDLALFEARFRDPHHIALLVRPFATKASTAGIFIWENGKIQHDSSYLEFPFRAAELGAGLVPETEGKAAPGPRPAPRAQIVPIASRREIPMEPAAPPPAPLATASAPVTPAAAAPPPAVEDKPAPAVADKPAEKPADKKQDKAARNDKNEKARTDKTAKAEAAPAVKPEPKTAVQPEVKPEKTETKSGVLALEITPEPKSGKGLKLVVAAAASIALFVALFVYPGFLRSGSKTAAPIARQDSSQLQLRVERSNGELLLTWNRDAEAIKNASKATLSITDGEQRENVTMDLSQLANGSIVYSPSGTDISFKMEVTDKNQKTTATETVRMLRTRPSPLNESAVATAKPAAGSTPAPGANATAAPADAAAATPETPVEQPKPVTALKPFQTESLSQRLRPAAATDLPDAPTVSAGNTSAAAAIPGVGTATMASIPAPVAPAAPSVPAPAAAPRTGGNIQQAVLIYRKDAEYPRIAKQTGAKGTVVLNATIGTDGTIKKVKVISGHPMLSNAAAEAVKQWRYRPTLLNGTAVEAETQVSINFIGDR